MIRLKLKEHDGSTVVDLAVLFFVGMILLAVAFEYIRIQLIAYNLKESFENAIRTVAVENYNEIYAGFREGKAVGGQFEGGPEGGGDTTEEPEWVELNDYGNVKEELEELLGIDDLSKGKGYAIQDIETKVYNADGKRDKYQVTGKMKIIIPIHLPAFSIKAEVPVKVECVYNDMIKT